MDFSIIDFFRLSYKSSLIFSDRHEDLLAEAGMEAVNPGSKMAVALSNTEEKLNKPMRAVTIRDIMDRVAASTYIIKTDIEKYDCKVY